MRVDKCFLMTSKFGIALSFCVLLAACGSEDSENADLSPSISIYVPTSAPSYSTTWTNVRLGGAISNAGFVHVTNALTGFTSDGFVTYYQGKGSWFADVYGLGFGENPITVTADDSGSGFRTANAYITVIRPLQPANLIFNGADQYTASTFWTDASSFDASHKIALFGDGTGRSTSGSALSENAGDVTDFSWTKPGPDSILILNCSTCSFQKISRISGSLNDKLFLGQIETVGGDEEIVLHAFNLYSGNL